MTESDISLREHFDAVNTQRDAALQAALASATRLTDQQIASSDKAVQAALAAADRLQSKIDKDRDAWQASSNEWRGAMNDREHRFVQKDVFDQTVKGLQAEIKSRGVTAVFGYIAGFLGLLSSVIAVVVVIAGRH